MPVDRFEAYIESTYRIQASERHDNVVDLVSSIGGAITGKGIKEFIKKLDNASEGKQ